MFEFRIFEGFVYASVFLIHEVLQFQFEPPLQFCNFTEVDRFSQRILIRHDWKDATVMFDYQFIIVRYSSSYLSRSE